MVQVQWSGDILAKAAEQAALEVARMTAEIVKGKAVDRCPYDSSHTREELTVNDIPKGAEISVDTPQAAWLHESESYTPQHSGTGPNFIRGPLLEEEAAFMKDVAAAMKAIFG
jgi:hypothetical protein